MILRAWYRPLLPQLQLRPFIGHFWKLKMGNDLGHRSPTFFYFYRVVP
jgi:hypothetical protein